MFEINEKALASLAIDFIFSYGCCHLSSKELQKLLVLLNLELEKSVETSTKLGHSPEAEKERKSEISKILKIKGGQYAINKLLRCTSEEEKYIVFNDIVRKSATRNGDRYNTDNTIVFPTLQMNFALIESNTIKDKITGRKRRSLYVPIQSAGTHFVERKVPNGKFSISADSIEVWRDKHSPIADKLKRIYTDKDVSDFYEIYVEDMLKKPSDIISEYFNRPETILTITRPELGHIYKNYFLTN